MHGKRFPGKAKALSSINQAHGFGKKLAQEGLRVDSQNLNRLASTSLQQTDSGRISQDVSKSIKEALTEMTPMLASSLAAAVESGAGRGAYGGSKDANIESNREARREQSFEERRSI